VHQIKELDDKFRELEKVEQAFRMGENKFDPQTREIMRNNLETLRNDLEGQRKRLAVVEKRPFVPATNDLKKDGRFIAYNNGTVLDTKTNLMWAAKDNGSNINWANAKSYCENYRSGGHTDWRMPTQDELAGLYDTDKTYRSDCGRDAHLTELIRLTCTAPWASETHDSTAAIFGFDPGKRYWAPQSRDNGTRALPVRSVK
jgi:hypothetical protein